VAAVDQFDAIVEMTEDIVPNLKLLDIVVDQKNGLCGPFSAVFKSLFELDAVYRLLRDFAEACVSCLDSLLIGTATA
jgi:hypothetical protein